MMGNLGRPGYLASTAGKWPYSYSNRSDCPPAQQPWSTLAPQAISACPNYPPPETRAKWGLLPGQGRGVPEVGASEGGSRIGGSGDGQSRAAFEEARRCLV